MNIKEIRKRVNEELIKNNVEDATMKTSLLLQYILGMDKTGLIVNDKLEISQDQQEQINRNIRELINGKPIQYITHHQEFMRLNFYVDENVLIPQPDTEILVEKAIDAAKQIMNVSKEKSINNEQEDKLKNKETDLNAERNDNENIKIRILDLCTGSGAIAITLEDYFLHFCANEIKILKEVASYNKKTCIQIYASDVSSKALEIAKKNAIINNENTNIRFVKSDMFKNIKEKFDIIVSNPPYIETNTISNLSKEVQKEPHIALDGGPDGLKFYRIIAKEAKIYLKKSGWLLLEIGYNQREAVSNLLSSEGYKEITCIKDLSGNDRVIISLWE